MDGTAAVNSCGFDHLLDCCGKAGVVGDMLKSSKGWLIIDVKIWFSITQLAFRVPERKATSPSSMDKLVLEGGTIVKWLGCGLNFRCQAISFCRPFPWRSWSCTVTGQNRGWSRVEN